jgi:hypothetical protein
LISLTRLERMKKSFLFLVVLCLPIVLNAQESSDFGIFAGMGYEHAETILPVPEFSDGILSMYPAVGAFYRKNLNQRYALRFGANYGFNTPYYTKVLASQLPVIPSQPQVEVWLLPIDLHALFEFNFLPLNPNLEKPKVSTFVAAGLGVYQMRPVIPFNVGVKYRATERIGLSIEWNLRKKFMTGSIDVLSKSPPSNWFSFFGLTAHYNIIKTCKTCPFYESNRKKRK